MKESIIDIVKGLYKKDKIGIKSLLPVLDTTYLEVKNGRTNVVNKNNGQLVFPSNNTRLVVRNDYTLFICEDDGLEKLRVYILTDFKTVEETLKNDKEKRQKKRM